MKLTSGITGPTSHTKDQGARRDNIALPAGNGPNIVIRRACVRVASLATECDESPRNGDRHYEECAGATRVRAIQLFKTLEFLHHWVPAELLAGGFSDSAQFGEGDSENARRSAEGQSGVV